MNYKLIYDKLIIKAQNRDAIKNSYFETHHIQPRCLGGSDDKKNLVELTPEEHYVAHQLLVKIYSNNPAIIRAAAMMIRGRPSNKLYGWLRRKLSIANSIRQSGKGNSQYGTVWVYNPENNANRKVSKSELNFYLESGWLQGRNVKFYNCVVCNISFTSKFKKDTCSEDCFKIQNRSFRSFEGREQEFLTHYQNLKSMNKALKAMGFNKGAVSHYYQWAKSLLLTNK